MCCNMIIYIVICLYVLWYVYMYCGMIICIVIWLYVLWYDHMYCDLIIYIAVWLHVLRYDYTYVLVKPQTANSLLQSDSAFIGKNCNHLLTIYAHSHEDENSNKTSNDNTPSVYSHGNVDRPKRWWKLVLFLAHHQSEFPLYFVRTLYQSNTR